MKIMFIIGLLLSFSAVAANVGISPPGEQGFTKAAKPNWDVWDLTSGKPVLIFSGPDAATCRAWVLGKGHVQVAFR